jgi:SAM-dependent methyltransferase
MSKRPVHRRDAERPPERRERRALSHVGGHVQTSGADTELARLLTRALDVRAEEASTMTDVHGFHSYPARMHPQTAARLIQYLSQPGDRVLDPFCGSGTVLVEARRLGRRALGIDANPLAVELAWLKTRAWSAAELAELVRIGHAAAEHAQERRAKKAGPTRRYGPEDREQFDVHVLLELDGLRDGVRKHARADQRRALDLVLSSILTKVSKRPGDTTTRIVERRLPGGHTIRLFERKTEELVRRLEQYAKSLPRGSPEPKVATGDARDLARVREGSVALIITSPPYPGVYDYFHQHATRLRWLGIDAREFDLREIGSRRASRGRTYDDVLAIWRRDLGRCLTEMARVLASNGRVCLILADSTVGRRALRSDRIVAELAPSAGLELVACGSQERPHFHAPSAGAFRDAPRREHVLVLKRRGREDAPVSGARKASPQERPSTCPAARSAATTHEREPERRERE